MTLLLNQVRYTPDQLSAQLGYSVDALSRMRKSGTGPAFEPEKRMPDADAR